MKYIRCIETTSGVSKRKQNQPEPKPKVTLEALKGEAAVGKLASRFGAHPTMLHQWKRALLEGAFGVFKRGTQKAPEVNEGLVKEPNAKMGGVGRLQGFFGQKAHALDQQVRCKMIKPSPLGLPAGRQCTLLSISRSSFYHKIKGESDMDLGLIRLMSIYHKPNTSKAANGHKIHTFILRGLRVNRPNQVRCADITDL